MGPEVTLALFGGLVPAGVAGATLLAAGCSRPRAAAAPRWAAGGAVALAFVASVLAGSGGQLPRLPAVAFHEWLFWLAPLLAALGALEPAAPARWWWGVRALAGAAVAVLLLWTPLTSAWTPIAGAAWVLGAAAGIVALWAPLARLAGAASDSRGALVAAVVGVAGGIALASTGSLMLGQLAMALGAASGAGFVLGAWQPRFVPTRSFAATFAGLLGGSLASGAYYSELPRVAALLLAAAPLAALAATPLAGRLGRFGPWLAPALGAGVAVGLALVPVALAALASSEPPYGY